MGEGNQYCYNLVISKCALEGFEHVTVYGIRAENQSDCSDCTQIEDIDPDEKRVRRLLTLVAQHQVEPKQLIYVVEDFILDTE